MRYNIALIPKSAAHYTPYSRAAQDNFGSHYRRYLLGRDSIPHITLCQFDDDGQFNGLEGRDKVQDLVGRLELDFINHVYHPTFIGLNFLKHDFDDLFSVELLVEREIRLTELHHATMSLVTNLGFEVLNAHGVMYRPHLTLTCVEPPNFIHLPEFPLSLLGTSTFPFIVRLGEADDYWQYTQVLK